MMHRLLVRLAFFGIALLLPLGGAAPLVAADTFAERSSKEEFPIEVSFTHSGKSYQLEATGAALRRKWFVKGYAIASYLQSPRPGDQKSVLDQIFARDKAKQLTIHWLHKLPAPVMRESFEESFHKVLPGPQYTRLEPEINKYLDFYTDDIKVGDMHDMRWLPGGYVELIVNGQEKGSLVSEDFAQALWKIWFGPDSVVNRKKLISRVVKR